MISIPVLAKGNELIHDFSIDKNASLNNKLNIVALDSSLQINEQITGLYEISINGLSTNIPFINGYANINLPIKKSGFLYLKYDNDLNNPSHLYYISISYFGVNIFNINLIWLLFIPICLILVGFFFRKLIGFAIFLLFFFIYFNHNAGLSIPTFFESILKLIKGIF